MIKKKKNGKYLVKLNYRVKGLTSMQCFNKVVDTEKEAFAK